MAERLVVWLYGTPVAELTPGRDYRITLRWRDEGVERWGRGSSVLSVGLPLGSVTGPRASLSSTRRTTSQARRVASVPKL